MDAAAVLARLVAVIDAHDWVAMPALLHEDFVCRLVHTGETFDRDGWVRFNADYPGFDRIVLQDEVAAGERAVGDDPAVVHDHRARAQLQRVQQVVGDHHRGEPE